MSEPSKSPTPPEYDADEHCKSVFAHAGLALYEAQCLEASIQGLLVVGGIVSGAIADQTGFEQLENKLRQFTLGRLFKDFRKDVELNAQAEELVNRALDRRNFVVHHFFTDRAVEFMGRNGRDAMIEELILNTNLFCMPLMFWVLAYFVYWSLHGFAALAPWSRYVAWIGVAGLVVAGLCQIPRAIRTIRNL